MKTRVISVFVILVAVTAVAGWHQFLVSATNGTPRLAVIEDSNGHRIAVEPVCDEVWNSLVELYQSGDEMWVGGCVETFLTFRPDPNYMWGFRFKPGTIIVAEVTAEGLQATIESISENLDYWLDIGRAYVFVKVTGYVTGDEIEVFAELSSAIITRGNNVAISAMVKDDAGKSLEGTTVTATIGDLEILFLLSDQGDGNYQGTINTSIVNEGTYEIAVTAQKEQYKPTQTSLRLYVTSNTLGGIEGAVTDHDGNPFAGMRGGIVSGTTFFPEIAAETNEEGYYQIGSVPPGTFEVAVHDIQGNRIGLESVTVRSGETSTLNFVIQSAPSDVTKFTAVVNGMRDVNVFVNVDLSNGLTREEAEWIAEATFIEVMGESWGEVMHRLDTLTFNDTQINAHYTWGIDENDMGHVFGMTADLTTLLITVNHCR
ncbi:MAG: carboxypeptidase-like regulatory domain-containing protein [Candidatus Hermodarchaeia archaeon]